MAARARTALREALRRSSGGDRLERTRRKGLRSSQLDQSETDRDRFDSMRHSGLGDTDGGGDREDDIVVVPVIEEPGPDPRRVRRARMSQGGQGKQDAQQQEDQGRPACHGRGRYSRRGRRATRGPDRGRWRYRYFVGHLNGAPHVGRGTRVAVSPSAARPPPRRPRAASPPPRAPRPRGCRRRSRVRSCARSSRRDSRPRGTRRAWRRPRCSRRPRDCSRRACAS